MFPKGIAIFFITIIVGAEVIHTHDAVKIQGAYQRLTRSEKTFNRAVEAAEALSLSQIEELEEETLQGPERDWQQKNDMCVHDGDGSGCTPHSSVAGEDREEGMCSKRPLPNDKSNDESCRLSESYMLAPGRVADYLQLQVEVLELKAAKFKRNCDSWWYTNGVTFRNVCARRTHQMLFATQFIAKAQEPETLEALDDAARARVQQSFTNSAGVLTDALGEQGDAPLVQKLMADVKASEVVTTHPQVVAQRMMATLKDLLKGTPAEKAAAKAYIAAGSVAAAPTEDEVGAETADVEREMTPEEIAAAKKDMAQKLDDDVAALTTPGSLPMDVWTQDPSARNSLVEVGDATDTVIMVVAYGVLITLAVLGAVFLVLEIVGAIAVWLAVVLFGCTVHQVGKADGRREERERAAREHRSSALQVEEGGLVVQSEGATELAETQGFFSEMAWCYVRWFALPFILVGRGFVWVVRKLRGTDSNGNQPAHRGSN